MFTECSAKAGYNIKALFRKLAAALPQSNDQGAGQQGQNQSNTIIGPSYEIARSSQSLIFS